jgi:hypothetical protein
VRRLATAAALVLALVPLAPGPARASVYTDVLHVYQRTGSIPPCQFSSEQLSAALRQIDTYGQQYFADFSNAVQTALTARAGGACSAAALNPSQAALHAPAGIAAPPLPPSVTSPANAGIPAPIVLMTVVIVLVAVVLAARAIAVATGFQPRWSLRWRHAWGEAGYRIGSGWGDFTDWLRGRR